MQEGVRERRREKRRRLRKEAKERCEKKKEKGRRKSGKGRRGRSSLALEGVSDTLLARTRGKRQP